MVSDFRNFDRQPLRTLVHIATDMPLFFCKLFVWFVRVVAFQPYIVLVAIGVLSSTCLIIPLITKNLPDFQDPQLGFEARGNDIGQRLTAFINLEEETRSRGSLTLNPNEVKFPQVLPKKPKIEYVPVEDDDDFDSDSDEIGSNDRGNRSKHRNANVSVIVKESQRNKTVEDEDWENPQSSDLSQHGPSHYLDNFFCGTPTGDFAHLVVTTAINSDLLSLHAVQEMCRFQEYLTSKPEYQNICESNKLDHCCPAWSLPNYLTMMFNHSSCHNITMKNILDLVDLLEMCAPFYYNLELSTTYDVPGVPPECSKHNAVYVILHYLVDTDFLPANQKSGELKNTMIFLPFAQKTNSIPLYESIDTRDLKLRAIKLAAVDFGLKNLLFDKYLVRDLWLVAAGSVFILICIWIYTHSFFITVMTVTAVIFSLAIAYCFYTLVLGLKFFPFMNILAAVVAIGIGSDDSFILCKVWQSCKKEKPDQSIVLLTHNILRHCALALFVTTVTTCAAFFSSFITNMTSIKCFSIFAGTSVAANFVLMLTWLPACIVIVERWSRPSATQHSPISSLTLINLELSNIGSKVVRCLVMTVIKLKYFFILMFGSIGLLSIFIVFYHPKLRLPDTAEFQLFKADHPFEQYELVYKEKFWFNHLQKGDSLNNPTYKMPLQFVWGVLPLDTGDYLDPSSRGKIHFDPSFDMSDAESQAWLLRFCRQLRNQTFYGPTFGPLLSNCFIESFIDWMKQQCIDRVDKTNRAPCCESEHFPFSKKDFSFCIKKAAERLHRTPKEFFASALAGPKFSKKGRNHIKAVIVEYQSNVIHSTSFVKMHKFFTEVEAWSKKIMSEAPPGMRNGWFISDLQFYNLQLVLAEDTILSIAVSMVVAFIVLLGVTLNIIISFLAILTVTFTITVTVAILVLLGWQLNVLESVAMNVAIGLAVDFSLHYAVNYRLCPSNNCRVSSVAYSLSMMAGPTVMAALTSGASGAFMLPSDVLAYRQIGVFLIDVMAISWLYSTFFLMPMLCIIGPENDFGQFSYPSVKAWLKSLFRFNEHNSNCRSVSSSVFANILSDSPFSMSSTTGSIQNSCCETHELDALQYSKSNENIKRSHGKSKLKGKTSADQSPSAVSSVTIIHDDDSNSLAC